MRMENMSVREGVYEEEQEIDSAEVYQRLEEAADEMYGAVEKGVRSFFENLDAGPRPMVAEGRIDIDTRNADAVYRSEQFVPGTGDTYTYRHVFPEEPAWDEFVKDVYAPVEASYMLMEELASEDVSREDLSQIASSLEEVREIQDAEAAERVFEGVLRTCEGYGVNGPEHVSRIVYVPEQ